MWTIINLPDVITISIRKSFPLWFFICAEEGIVVVDFGFIIMEIIYDS